MNNALWLILCALQQLAEQKWDTIMNMDDRLGITRKEFNRLVNMTVNELEDWLQTEESQSVGISLSTGNKKTSVEGGESVGHASGRRIIDILQKDKTDLEEDDFVHMRKVIGYIKRHSVQQPEKQALETSRWRYSLMNWGHDPLK